MYRPEGWDGYEGAHNALRDDNSWLEDEHTACYEAGADAMLEGLLKLPVSLKKDGQTWLIDPAFAINAWKKGYLVFIPEEE